MPQITNLTVGPAVTLEAKPDLVLRAVPSRPGVQSTSWESAGSSPALATRLSASTRRKADFTQSTMLRINQPIVRVKDGIDQTVATNIGELTLSLSPLASEAEKEEALVLLFKAARSSFFTSVIVGGESMN